MTPFLGHTRAPGLGLGPDLGQADIHIQSHVVGAGIEDRGGIPAAGPELPEVHPEVHAIAEASQELTLQKRVVKVQRKGRGIKWCESLKGFV